MLKKGQIAVVTGAAQGIGRAIALSLAARGIRVMCLDIAERENQETARLAGSGCQAYLCDVSDPAQISNTFDRILAEYGTIDILINNAAIFSTMSLVKDDYETALRDWQRNMDTNARSTLLCSKKAAPVMAQHGSGQIINVITNHVKRYLYPPSDSEHSYDASKYAQLALNESLDQELKPYGIRVNAICPAATRSPMLEHFFEDLGMELTKENIGKCAGIASLLESEEVGEAVCHMLAWDASQPTGKAILLLHSEDCESLKEGYQARLGQ